LNVAGLLVSFAAALSLWLGAARRPGSTGRGYRWLAGTAVFWFAGLLAGRFFAGTLGGFAGPLSLADLAPLVALAPAAMGIAVLGAGGPPGEPGGPAGGSGGTPGGDDPGRQDNTAGCFTLPALADGYVLAAALLLVGWVVVFGTEYLHSGEGPGTFLLSLIHPLTDVAVLGLLLGAAAVRWRQVALPYLALAAMTAADFAGVGARLSGGHQQAVQQAAQMLAFCLLGLAPWATRARFPVMRRIPHGPRDGTGQDEAAQGGTRQDGAGQAALQDQAGTFQDQAGVAVAGEGTGGSTAVAAALAVGAATIVVLGKGLAAGLPAGRAVAVASGPLGLAVAAAGGAALLILAARVLVLVTENRAALRGWRESGTSLRELADRTSDVVLVSDLTGLIRYASPAVGDFGYAPEYLAGLRMEDLVHPEDRASAIRAVRTALSREDAASEDAGEEENRRGESGAPGATGAGGAGGTRPAQWAHRFSCRVRAADGTWRHVESTVMRYRLPGERDQLLVTARDVSGQVALRQQVTHLTFHDGLTGLPNRAYVEERAADALRRHGEGGKARAGVIFLDLDRFTAVNDSVGHGAGDLVLAQAGRRLRAVVPSHGTVARWGSDEFAVVIGDATGVQEIADIAERMGGAVASEPFHVASRDIALTASIGVALSDGSPPGLVLRNADVAMSRAKAAGGGRVEIFAAHMHADVVRRLELASDLQQAVARHQLTLQYQPVVELATSRVTGAEALVRWWRHGEVVPPAEFLGVAEESGLIVPLGDWVLAAACAQGAAWRRSSWNVGVSVNISLRQINNPRFPEAVATALADSGLPPDALTVEVTEKILVADSGLLVGHLADLRRLGVRLAIDDFGTGYASLAHLRGLPVDIIKIDPSFVAGLGQDETLTLLTRTIVQVGRDLGISVVAEGIEHPRQLCLLREMGCGYGQGFLVARPMGASAVESLIGGEAVSPPGRPPGPPRVPAAVPAASPGARPGAGPGAAPGPDLRSGACP
jgi:diguanylate cyclase (GGDEF)-like protein/PAS domain S-box-containing protein